MGSRDLITHPDKNFNFSMGSIDDVTVAHRTRGMRGAQKGGALLDVSGLSVRTFIMRQGDVGQRGRTKQANYIKRELANKSISGIFRVPFTIDIVHSLNVIAMVV
jgi:hypothetical protein